MATIAAKIFKHHKKADGTYNVKICLAHKDQRVYINTTHFVTEKQIRNFEIKDTRILSAINKEVDNYRGIVSDLAYKLDRFTAQTLREYLLKKNEEIDFFNFCQIHIDKLGEEGRTKSKIHYQTVRNSIQDFMGYNQSLPIENITVNWIKDYEYFLRHTREMIRKDKFGRYYTRIGKPLPDSTVHIYLTDFQGLFSAAIDHYNRPGLGLMPIKYNPFKEYKIVDAPETKKRSLTINEIILIRDCKTRPLSRAELAQQLSMLSFYLCGMNAVDLYKKDYFIKKGRIEYSRSKTQNKRKDKAFISIKIPPEAVSLLQFAAAIPKRYASIDTLNTALSEGMAQLVKITKIPKLQFYMLRHSFGNHARNTCRKSKDDVALALNHIDRGHKTTDTYIAKDWTIVDDVQDSVLNLIRP